LRSFSEGLIEKKVYSKQLAAVSSAAVSFKNHRRMLFYMGF
jgi:hypothetical protein